MNKDALAEQHRRYQLQASWTESFQRSLFSAMPASPPWKVLEVGCGTGAVMNQQRQFTSSAFAFFGIDPDWHALSFARSDTLAALSCARGEQLPFADSTFDIVECHYLLLWLKAPVTVLRELSRVCKPGGKVAVLAEPDYQARITFPAELEQAAQLQTDALIAAGMNPAAGRQVLSWMIEAGFENPVSGIHGTQLAGSTGRDFLAEEFSQLEKDSAQLAPADVKALPHAVFYVPTFYCLASK